MNPAPAVAFAVGIFLATPHTPAHIEGGEKKQLGIDSCAWASSGAGHPIGRAEENETVRSLLR